MTIEPTAIAHLEPWMIFTIIVGILAFLASKL